MKEQTFEEQFPDLKGMYVPIPIGDGIQPPEEYDMAIRLELIGKHCLDKQKVRDAIKNPKNFMESDIGRIPDLEAIEKELGL